MPWPSRLEKTTIIHVKSNGCTMNHELSESKIKIIGNSKLRQGLNVRHGDACCQKCDGSHVEIRGRKHPTSTPYYEPSWKLVLQKKHYDPTCTAIRKWLKNHFTSHLKWTTGSWVNYKYLHCSQSHQNLTKSCIYHYQLWVVYMFPLSLRS